MKKILLLVLLLMLVFKVFSQIPLNSNDLTNYGEICTIAMGNEYVTVNNENNFIFPFENLENAKKEIDAILEKYKILEKLQSQVLEAEINLHKKMVHLEEEMKLHEYKKNINQYKNVLENDTLKSFSLEDKILLKELTFEAETMIKSTECLIKDYNIQKVKESSGGFKLGFEKALIENDPNYIYIYPFQENLAKVKQYDKYGFIDIEGNIVIPIKYDSAQSFSQNRALVWERSSNGKVCFFIDQDNKKISPDILDANPYSNNVAWAKISNYTMKNRFNRHLKGDYFHVLLNNKGGLVLQGKRAAVFDSLYTIENGFGIGIYQNKIGITSLNGKVIHHPKFNNIGEFSEGYCAVQCDNNSWGTIDSNGQIHIRCIYHKMESFKNGLAIITEKKDSIIYKGVINYNGASVVPPIFDKIQRISKHEFTVYKGLQNFIIDRYGRCRENQEKKMKYNNLLKNQSFTN